jgi:hypothetical protein
MGRLLFFSMFLSLVFIESTYSQEMNPEKLKGIISKVSNTAIINGNSIHFFYQEKPLICVFDANANRMRIISPIIEREKLGEEELLNALVANFHSVLDVKYALSDEIIWSVFIHPLKELTKHQVVDAVKQVYAASINFGTTYSSTNLVFPGNTKKKEAPYQKKLIEKF